VVKAVEERKQNLPEEFRQLEQLFFPFSWLQNEMKDIRQEIRDVRMELRAVETGLR
jgi:hypothetical protein